MEIQPRGQTHAQDERSGPTILLQRRRIALAMCRTSGGAHSPARGCLGLNVAQMGRKDIWKTEMALLGSAGLAEECIVDYMVVA